MILILQSASPTTKMWLIKVGQTPAAPDVDWDSGRQLADQLLGRINDLLESKTAKLSDLTGIVIFSGPGSFTSLRIGHTVANALADSLAIPVVGPQGENWLTDGVGALAKAKPGLIALPFYGAEANITRPK